MQLACRRSVLESRARASARSAAWSTRTPSTQPRAEPRSVLGCGCRAGGDDCVGGRVEAREVEQAGAGFGVGAGCAEVARELGQGGAHVVQVGGGLAAARERLVEQGDGAGNLRGGD